MTTWVSPKIRDLISEEVLTLVPRGHQPAQLIMSYLCVKCLIISTSFAIKCYPKKDMTLNKSSGFRFARSKTKESPTLWTYMQAGHRLKTKNSLTP